MARLVQKLWRHKSNVLLSLLVAIAIYSLSACDWFTPRLAVIDPITNPALPAWIAEISPLNQAKALDQIRVIFREPLVPVERIDSPDQQEILAKFELQPAITGQFRLLTPRMVSFQSDRALPFATRFKITLKSGLADLKQNKLAQDLAWTFNTPPLELQNLPGKTTADMKVDPVDLLPQLEFNANTKLDLKSLIANTSLTSKSGKNVGFKVVEKNAQEPLTPGQKLDSAKAEWKYVLTPDSALAKADTYNLSFAPGILPAIGNLGSTNEYRSEISTYPPLIFSKIGYFGLPNEAQAYGRFTDGGNTLEFSNEIVDQNLEKLIEITPKPKGIRPLFRSYGSNQVEINPYALEPNTEYKVSIDRNLKDKFGQTLEQPVSTNLRTGNVAAEFYSPNGLHIFPTNQNLQLNLSAVNLPESFYRGAFRVLQPTDLVYTDVGSPASLLPKPENWQNFRLPSAATNQNLDISIPLTDRLSATTGMLAYGVKAKTYKYLDEKKEKWRQPEFFGTVQLTNLGVFAQWFPESGMVRVHHLSDGVAAANVDVDIYLSKLDAKSQPQPTVCATAKTNADGVAIFNRENLSQCMGGTSFNQAPDLLSIAREAKDWAFTRTPSYGNYAYGIYGSWEDQKQSSRGIIFSDRKLYKPGEEGWFTGVAYYLQNGELKQDRNVSYALTLIDPSDKKTQLGSFVTNNFGTFSFKLPLAKDRALGFYQLEAKGESGVQIRGDFRLAEFKPPNFKVDLSLASEQNPNDLLLFAKAEEKIMLKPQSNYLFGAPVESAKVKYNVTRKQTKFIPKGWENFSFGAQWFYPQEAPAIASEVLETVGSLDVQGKGIQTLAIAKEIPYAMEYQVDAEVSDVSNLAVTASKTFTVLPSDRVIGLQQNFVGEAGKPFASSVIVTDAEGKAIVGETVKLELQQMKYSQVTQVVEGSTRAKSQVEFISIAQADIRSDSQPQTVSLTAKEGGSYRIRATLANNPQSITDSQIWITGTNQISWSDRTTDNRLTLKLDKATYKPGEIATVLVQSPYPEAELYFAIVRDRILYQSSQKVQGSAPQIKFTVTPEMLPNAAVEAVLVRQGEALEKTKVASISSLAGVGFAPFAVNLDRKYLKLEANPAIASLLPGTEQTIQFKLKDAQGNPQAGQITMMVVNEAVLQLTGYRVPDLVKTIYAEHPITTRFSDNRPEVVLQALTNPLEKGWGYGGGTETGAGNTRIRKDFQAIAYYNGAVLTDAQGIAAVKFKLPDDLTTWRVMAVALDGNMNFGNNSDATFQTSKPLQANPLLPQFVRPGDRLEAGLSVTNTTALTGDLAIKGTLNGAIQFVEGNGTLSTNLESGTRAYRFPMQVQESEKNMEAKVAFSLLANGGSNGADGFEFRLPTKPYHLNEQVIESGRLNEDRLNIPLNLDPKVISSNLEVSLASTLIPQITASAEQIFGQQNLPFLETNASQLAIAANLKILSQTLGISFNQFNLTQVADKALQNLQLLQLSNGGFAAYPKQENANPYVTPYAARSVARAIAAGFKVNENLTTNLKTYLKKLLADPNFEDVWKVANKNQVRLDTLLALSALGELRNDFLSDIYSDRVNLDFPAQIQLASLLSKFPDWQKEAQALAQEISQRTAQTGANATVNNPDNYPSGWRWLGSATVAQSQALRLCIARQDLGLEPCDRLLQSLLAMRRQGNWAGTYNNAEALGAIAAYLKIQPTPPDFSATATLGSKLIGKAEFKGYRNPSQTFKTTELKPGKSEILLQKSGRGTLHYRTTYAYRLPAPQVGQINGLRVIRSIYLLNNNLPLQQHGLLPPADLLKLSPGKVFDIGLEIICDRPIQNLVITDPLPAGLEPIDASFKTANPSLKLQASDWKINYQTIGSDRITAYSDQLEPGVYSLHYLVRSVTPGIYNWAGTEAHLQYAPEEFGRTAAAKLQILLNQ